MSYFAEIVILDDLGYEEKVTQELASWKLEDGNNNITPRLASSVSDVITDLQSGQVLILIVFAKSYSEQLRQILETYETYLGAFCEHILVVNSSPAPAFAADLYEHGIENLCSEDEWMKYALDLASLIKSYLTDDNSSFLNVIKLMGAIANKNNEEIEALKISLADSAQYDFRVALAAGKGSQILGDTKGALAAFENGTNLNKRFRPVISNFAQSLLKDGQTDRALGLIEKLEKTNPDNVQRKTQLIKTYIEVKQYEKAEEKISEMRATRPSLQLIDELQADLYLKKGDIEKAMGVMGEMSNVGNDFAAILNEHGVRLAQEGKGKEALELYQKAHQIVRVDLKYKISLNAALACIRFKAFPTALKFIDRCEQEYGKKFPKSESIRKKIMEGMNQEEAKKVG
ncbi:MAG: hypothetical protein KBD78_11215 [Oligoflexales bacterium]|nr:hypothetical protein [Oligoflexales bacterium]